MSFSKGSNDNNFSQRYAQERNLKPNHRKIGRMHSHSINIVAVFAVNYIATIKSNQSDVDTVEKMLWDKKLEVYEKKPHPVYLKFLIRENNILADLIIQRVHSETEKKVTVKSVKLDSKSVRYFYLSTKDSLNLDLHRILIFSIINKQILSDIRNNNPEFGSIKDMQQNMYSVPDDLTVVVRNLQLYCLPKVGYFVSEMCEKMASPLKRIFSTKGTISKISERNGQREPNRPFRNCGNSDNSFLRKEKRNIISPSFLDQKSKSIESLLLTNVEVNNLVSFSSFDQRSSSITNLQNSLSNQSSLNNDESQDSSNPIDCKFEDLLSDERGLKYFKDFLKKEVSSENILFWEAIQKFLEIKNFDQMKEEAAEIFYSFMDEKSDTPVNLECDVVEQVRSLLDNPHVNMFNAARTHIFYLMKTDSFNRFKKSTFFYLWLDEYKNTSVIKKASSTSSLTRVKGRLTFLPNLFKNKKDKRKKDDSRKSSQTFDSDCSNSNLSSTCKITIASEYPETHSVQIHTNRKLIYVLKKLDKRFLENDFVAFDLLDDRVVPFSESMSNMVGRRIIVEKAVIIRVGYVQVNMDINLIEYVWFVIRPRHHLCLSNALDPVAKLLELDLGMCIVIKEDDPQQIEWNTQIYLLNKCSLLLIKLEDFRRARFYSKSLANNLDILWKKMMNNDSFLSNMPFNDYNILDSRHELLSKYKLEPRKVGYMISNFIQDNENFDTLTNRKGSYSYDDQRGICTNDQLAMPDFLKSVSRQESEDLSSSDSQRHSELFFGDSDLSFSEFEDFSDPSPTKLELVSDLE